MESKIWCQTQAQVAKYSDLISASVTRQERICWMGTAVGCEVISQLFGELEPGSTSVWLLRVLLIRVGSATGRLDCAGVNAKNGIGHTRPIERLFAGVVCKVVQRILRRVVVLVIQRECNEDHVRLFDRDTAIHAGIFINYASIPIA